MTKRGKRPRIDGLQEANPAFTSTFGDRLSTLLDRFDSRSEAASVAGVVPEQLAKYVRGAAKPTLEVMARLVEAKGVSLDWLATGEGRLAGESSDAEVIHLPIWDGDASSGHGSFASGGDIRGEMAFSRWWLGRLVSVSFEKLIVVFNRGDSNAPDLDDGDAMIVERGVERIADGAYHLFDEGGVLLVKMIELQVGGSMLLKSRNPDYATRTLTKAEATSVIVFGRVRARIGAV